MKFEDTSQNLRARLRFIQVLVILMLGLLSVRLYVLQVVRGERYAEIAENQRRRRLPIPAPRGVIFDREGRVLVDSRPIYNVILSREDVKGKDLNSLIEPLSEGLTVDKDILREYFELVKTMPAFESIMVKQDATPGDIAWVEAHNLEFPELRVEQQPQRRYPANGSLAHVLGYVGEISPEQLKQQASKDKGLKPGDIIGLSGIEQIYDDYLRGKDGYREVVVDSRGRIQDEIETVDPIPGRDLVTTIDLDLQLAAEEQLQNSATQARRDHLDGSEQRRDPGARFGPDFRSKSLFTTNHDERRPRRVRRAPERSGNAAPQSRGPKPLSAGLHLEDPDGNRRT